MFKINMGKVDRSIRSLIAAAIAILIYAEVLTGVWKVIFGIIAIVFTLTAAVGTCPLYLLFGIRTCPRDKSHA